jgi:hypothetical protein
LKRIDIAAKASEAAIKKEKDKNSVTEKKWKDFLRLLFLKR